MPHTRKQKIVFLVISLLVTMLLVGSLVYLLRPPAAYTAGLEAYKHDVRTINIPNFLGENAYGNYPRARVAGTCELIDFTFMSYAKICSTHYSRYFGADPQDIEKTVQVIDEEFHKNGWQDADKQIGKEKLMQQMSRLAPGGWLSYKKGDNTVQLELVTSQAIENYHPCRSYPDCVFISGLDTKYPLYFIISGTYEQNL